MITKAAEASFSDGKSNSLSTIIDTIANGLASFTGIAIILCSIIATFEVVARAVFQYPTTWTHEVIIWLMIAFAFTSVAYGLKEGSHVRVDAITKRFSKETRDILYLISLVFVLAYGLIFVYFSGLMVVDSFRSKETSDMLLAPLWPLKAVIFVAMAALCLQALKMIAQKLPVLSGIHPARTILVSILMAGIFGLLGIWIPENTNFAPISFLLLLLFMLASGTPVGFAIGMVTCTGYYYLGGSFEALIAIPEIAYWSWDSFTLMALPLFIFVGHIMLKSGIARDLLDFTAKWVGHLPGGMAVAALASCAIFAAISGSSVVNAATIGLVAIPILVEMNYDRKMVCGLIAAGGTMGILIPPSAAMITYGVVTEESIGFLFIAGLIPGILLFLALSAVAMILCKISGKYQPLPKAPWRERISNFKQAVWGLLMPVIVLGGIYTGVFTPSESAAVAVVYGMVYMIFIRKMSLSELFELTKDSTKTVAMICIMMSAALALAKIIAMLQIPQAILNALIAISLPGWLLIVLVMVALIVMGMFLGAMEITLLTMPILAPVLTAMDFNLSWFAVLFTLNMEMGLISPPFGLNLFVVQQISGTPFEDILAGVWPFAIGMLVVLILVAFFPCLSLWLPSTMG